jgi:hypothetical protein
LKTSFSKKYSIITFATNKLNYLHFAFNCARSVLLFNDIDIYIITNIDHPVPCDIKHKTHLLNVNDNHADLGSGAKIFLDEYIQTKYSLFIDADCLCYGSLDAIFNACKGQSTTVAGNIVPAEKWCGEKQAATIKKEFGLSELISFNAGIIYLEKNETAHSIFNTARAIAEKYDEYGFDRNNGWINEEAPLSIAMVMNKQLPIADDGRYMTDLFTDRRPKRLNVLSGDRELSNPPPPMMLHRPWYPSRYSPLILHFGGANLNSYPYNSQRLMLGLYRKHLSAWAAALIVNIFINLPYRSWHWLTGSLRKLKTR